MEAIAKAKVVKLSNAQREALKTLYTAYREGKSPSWKWAIEPTKISLFKMGLIKGEMKPKSFRHGEFLSEHGELSDTGLALATELFSMDWWAELLGAYINKRREFQRMIEAANESTEIAERLGISKQFTHSCSGKNYRARFSTDKYSVNVERGFMRISDDIAPYEIKFLSGSGSLYPDDIAQLTLALENAAYICRAFEKEATS